MAAGGLFVTFFSVVSDTHYDEAESMTIPSVASADNGSRGTSGCIVA
jgi:hypothetical protein